MSAVNVSIVVFDGMTEIPETIALDLESFAAFSIQEAATLEECLGADGFAEITSPDSVEWNRRPGVLRSILFAKIKSAASPRVRPFLSIDSFDLSLDELLAALPD